MEIESQEPPRRKKKCSATQILITVGVTILIIIINLSIRAMKPPPETITLPTMEPSSFNINNVQFKKPKNLYELTCEDPSLLDKVNIPSGMVIMILSRLNCTLVCDDPGIFDRHHIPSEMRTMILSRSNCTGN